MARISTPMLAADGSLYVMPSAARTIAIAQDGDRDVTVNGSAYQDVGHIHLYLQDGGNTLSIDSSVSVPLVVYGSGGGDTIADNGGGDAEIHGGQAANVIQGGAGEQQKQLNALVKDLNVPARKGLENFRFSPALNMSA